MNILWDGRDGYRRYKGKQTRVYHSENTHVESLYVRISSRNKKSIWVISNNEAL